jgi:8-oxo-dGTP pyrophosphatase MutT (NUDIX family)
MLEERSAGAGLFYGNSSNREYLILHYPSGHWDFPKGNIEPDETIRHTVRRETKEETGIGEIDVRDGFEKKIEYYYRRDGQMVHKVVVMLLAESKSKDVKISFEHKGFSWLHYPEALAKLTFRNAKSILKDAEDFLNMRPAS